MMKKLKVHIIGTHGVPAKYGGFETLADYLCQNLNEDFDITVYCNSNKYSQKTETYFGVKLKYINIEASGFKGIFYDLLSYVISLTKADIILYLSPVGSGFMTPLRFLTGKKVIVNHGGLNEWEREKLNWIQKTWAKFNHHVAAKFANINIADNRLYQKSLKQIFNADSIVIRYGGDHVTKIASDDVRFAKKYPFVKDRYAISVSRAQLDNNIHIVLEAFECFLDYKIVLISNWDVSNYGKELKAKYYNHPNMILLDAIYNKDELDYIRGNAWVYIHSHSRCGTAPSLVEAMYLKQAILSFDVPTNRETTKGEAFFFQDVFTLQNLLCNTSEVQIKDLKKKLFSIASEEYTWVAISQLYRNAINYLGARPKYIKKTNAQGESRIDPRVIVPNE